MIRQTIMLGITLICASCADPGNFRGSGMTKRQGATSNLGQQRLPSGSDNKMPEQSTAPECAKNGEKFEIDDWQPLINAPEGFLYGKDKIIDLKTVKSAGEGNVVLKSAPNLSVGAQFPGKSYLLYGYEMYNDTGEKNHFGEEWAVEVSSDGQSWTTVEPAVTGVLGIQKYEFKEPILGSYIRMRLTGLPYGAGWDVWWLKFFGYRVECK